MTFLGSQLSFYPFINTVGQLNLVSGDRAVSHRIIHLLLLRKGEDPVHPDMGIAPQLYDPLSEDNAYRFAYDLETLLRQWNTLAKIGIGSLEVRSSVEPARGKIEVRVSFTSTQNPYDTVLTFGYRELIDGFNTSDIRPFIDSLSAL